MEYTVVKANHIDTLIEEVNRLMKEGWRPIGGIGLGTAHLYQAMVRG